MSTVRPRARERPEVQRQRILAAAVEVFGRVGVNEALIGDIAKEANVSRTLVYHYFPGKQQIVDALMVDAFAEIEELVVALRTRGGTIRQQVEWLVDGYYRVLTDRPSIVNILTCDVTAAHPPSRELERRMRKLRRSLLEWVKDLPGVDPGVDPERFLLVALGSMFIWFFPTQFGKLLGARPGTRGKTLQAHKDAVRTQLVNALLGP